MTEGERGHRNDATFLAAGAGERIVFSERRALTVKWAAPEMVVLAHELAAGEDGPPLHLHKSHTDAFYVVHGELVVSIGGDERVIGAGSFVAIPPDTPHTFLRAHSESAHFLNVHAPGLAFDEYMRREAEMTARGASDAEKSALAERFDEFQL